MERLDSSVRRALRSAGVPDAGQLAEITRAWPGAVGPSIAAAAWPQRLAQDGTLHVTTASSTWAFELGRMAADVLEKLRAEAGEATPSALRFAPGPLPATGPVEERADLPRPTPDEVAAAASLSAAIEDPDLREAVRKAAASSLARARRDRPV